MNFDKCTLRALTRPIVEEISQWEYEKPFDIYNFKGHSNGYLWNEETWGKEQFCLICADKVIGQVACQLDNDELWVGWSLSPLFCGMGNGHLFVVKCVEEIRKLKNFSGSIYLRVAASNQRAIKAYQKAGFVYVETIQDEVAYTNHMEDFWIMVNEKNDTVRLVPEDVTLPDEIEAIARANQSIEAYGTVSHEDINWA